MGSQRLVELWDRNRPPAFDDRDDAGRQLARAMPVLDPDNTVVIALPRGGVPVAEQICRAHGLPLDLILVRKIGAPGQRELALGAIVDGEDPMVVINEGTAAEFGLTPKDVMTLGKLQLPEIARRRAMYRLADAPTPVQGKVVVVVDDGIATGASMQVALVALRRRGAAKIILAVPVAPPDRIDLFAKLADETICLRTPEPFHAVGFNYRDFAQVSDRDVARILEGLREFVPEPQA